MKHIDQLTPPPVTTRRQMELLVREITGLKLDEQLLVADRDRELRAVRNRYERRLQAVGRALAARIHAAREWAESNPAAFGRRRSLDFGHGRAGFRMAPPRLQPLSHYKWDDILAALRGLPWGAYYLRVHEEINKEQIIADVGAGKLPDNALRQVGAQVMRDEIFYVESVRKRGR